ncbi:MAG: phosphoribosylformylglycinamidine synthase subunit PurS [Acidobacteria bacterium]|nr:phosphoribosylformylglycinamidine synthase subunit PurS [Acidobacteriota bacterium]
MITRIEVGTRPGFVDPRGESVARKVREHLGIAVGRVRTRDVYHVEAEITAEEARRIAEDFAGPVLKAGAVGRLEDGPFDVAVSVGFKPGVTDPVGKSARVAIEDLLGRDLGEGAVVYTSRLYLLSGASRAEAQRIARELLANEVIERVAVQLHDEWRSSPPSLAVPKVAETAVPEVEAIPLELPDAGLLELSRHRLLSLTLDEMRAIRDFYRRAGRDPLRLSLRLPPHPTDVELECLAQTWSEHCKHKIFNATIEHEEPGSEPATIRSLFKTYIKGSTESIRRRSERSGAAPFLVSVFEDNAGVIAATERHHLVFKVETHNTPSALDPYGGSITGIVGVNRDPFGTGIGADLLANVWGYCFAPPDHAGELPAGLLHPRRVREGVHAGVIDGGNQSGIPYARGWEFFDERYIGKPLVYCGTIGRLPVTVAGRPSQEKLARGGDRIVMVGGRIGKDGIHGATFSSAELTEESPVQAVQIGDPITQKMMFDFLLEARDRGLYTSITDNGAGGLSSSIGEMARGPGGARLDLARAPLKYHGLAPWEILLSEAQERMSVAVPPARLEEFLELAARREVEATDLGEFTADGMLHVTYGERTVAWLPLEFLHDGLPEMRLKACWRPPEGGDPEPLPVPTTPEAGNAHAALLLARYNLASNELLARTYDHEVKGLSIVKPWIGTHRDVPSDATVMLIDHAGWEGFAVADGVFPTYSDIDAFAMAQAGLDLAVRRVITSGARLDRVAALDNFCWIDPLPGPSNPDAEHRLAQLVRACRGLAEACEAYGVPLISGKDSMKNDAVIAGQRISIPPTLLASAIGVIEDARLAVTLERRPSDRMIVVVGETRAELGASEWAAARGATGVSVPRCRPAAWAARYRAVSEAIRGGLAGGAHAIGRGGLLPALFYLARAAGSGVRIDLRDVPVAGAPGWEALLFGESCGRFLLTVGENDAAELLDALEGHSAAVIGTFAGERLELLLDGRAIVDAPVEELALAWRAEERP